MQRPSGQAGSSRYRGRVGAARAMRGLLPVYHPAAVIRGVKVAAVVGTLLNLLNHGPALAGGTLVLGWPLLLNYVVPFCVSVYSSARADLRHMEGGAFAPPANPNMEPAVTRATWNNAVLAESDDVLIVDGYHYFPRDEVRMDYLQENETRTRCAWKGTAHYFDLVVEGHRNAGAAWHYHEPMPRASDVRGRIAFWKGVEVS